MIVLLPPHPLAHTLPHNAPSIPKSFRFHKFPLYLRSLCLVLLFLSQVLFIAPPALARSARPSLRAPRPASPVSQPAPQDPGVIPVPKQPENVILAAFTVDVSYVEEETANYWQVITRARLHNPSTTQPVTAVLSLTGADSRGTPLQDLRLAPGTDPQKATPYPQDTYTVALRPDERQWFTLVYTDRMATADFPRFRYDLSRLTRWPTIVGSVRVTLHFPRQVNRAAILHRAPDPTRFDGLSLDWQWENLTPRVAIDVLLVRPSLWDRLQALRVRRAAGETGAGDELAQTLLALLTANEPPVEAFERLYPEAVALWSERAEAHPQDAAPWRALALLYTARARLESPPDPYQTLALGALAQAWQRGDRDPAVRDMLARVAREQIATLRGRRKWQEALSTLASLADLLGPEGEEEITALRQEIARAWAQERLDAADAEGVRQALVAGWGEDILTYFTPHTPRFRRLDISVQTREQTRIITATVIPFAAGTTDEEAQWAADVEALQQAIPDAAVSAETMAHAYTLQITIPFETPETLIDVGRRAAHALDLLPEWAPLIGVLQPRQVQVTETITWWGKNVQWTEEVDLTAARRSLDEALASLQAALEAPPPPDFPADLVPIWRALQEQDLNAWQALRDQSSIVYTLRWEEGLGPPQLKRWHVAPGEKAILRAERRVIAPGRSSVTLAAALILWTVLSLILWHRLRYPWVREGS